METISAYGQNVRYQLAKQQLEQQFLKWLSNETVNSFIFKLIEEVHDPTENILSPPTPIFISKIAAPVSPSNKNAGHGPISGTIGHTPPRSPSGADKYKTLVNPVFEPIANREEEKDIASRTLTRSDLTKALKKSKVPKFYYEDGKPLPQDVVDENNKVMEETYAGKTDITVDEFVPIVEKIFKFPKFLNTLVFNRIDTGKTGKISKQKFKQVWENKYEKMEVSKRLFKILAKPDAEYIVPDDFKPMMRHLLDSHPGLDFLKATPEFQDRYADTVIMRLFYAIDTNDDGRISYRDLK